MAFYSTTDSGVSIHVGTKTNKTNGASCTDSTTKKQSVETIAALISSQASNCSKNS